VDKNIIVLREIISHSCRIVAFTGAGISTESGISDFRSPGGIWSKMSPIDYQDFVTDESARRKAWRRRIAVDTEISSAKPNRGHRAIAKLNDIGKLSCVITQNVDGLHQLSGISDEKIIELHGNTTYAKCLECNARYELKPIIEIFKSKGLLPTCSRCGGIVKVATISFGQKMPAAEMNRAQVATQDTDLLLAIGSSLLVYPAAAIPVLAKTAGAALVIINRDQTELDSLANLVINAEIGETLGQALNID